MAFQCYNFTLVLQLYTPVIWKLHWFSANQTSVIFFHVYYSQIHGSCKLVVFETLTSAYEHQIALETMLLPLQIDNMYKRKTN